MNNGERVYKDLTRFIAEITGVEESEISRDSLIEDDLGITGAEAFELIGKVSVKFDMDISSFKPEKYFYPEPSIYVTFGKVEPLTIGNLCDGVLLGKLE